MVNRRSVVKIEKDGMEAWIYLYKPVDADVYDKREIIKFLQDNHVKYGYIESNIAAICKKRIYKREIRVAVGDPGTEGHSGYYEYFFETDIEKLKRPSILANGSVDYRSVSIIQNVNEGDLLAKYHPAERGRDGMDVNGNLIKAADVRELMPLTGKGIIRSEENQNEYYAAINGRVSYDKGTGKVSVIDVHYVTGDADLANNPYIEFNGDIVVQGNVESGVVIRAGRSLSVDGVVEAADLQAGGDIIVKRGILANNTGSIVSNGGDVIADFIEHGNVRAKGKIQANIIMNSNIHTNGKVILEGRKGYIMGGTVHALAGIKAVSVGNDAEIKTVLHAGCEEKFYDKKRTLTKQDEDLAEELSETVKELKELIKIEKNRGLSNSQKKQFIEKKGRKDQIENERKKINSQIAKMESIEAIAQNATIRIEGNIYRGTMIAIDRHHIMIDRDTSYMEYRNKSGIIEGNVIVVN